MSRCCVDECSDTADGKVFFTFPASKTLRRKWLDAAPVKEKVTMDSVICNLHFHEHEYEWVRGKTRLKAKVVPSVFKTSRPKPPPKEPQQHVEDVNIDTPTAIDNRPQSTKKKKSEMKNNIEIEQNGGGLVKRQEPNSSLDEANKDIEEIITNYQIKQIRPINREIETEKLNGDTRENGERWNGMREDMDDSVTIEEDADPVYIEVSVDKAGGQGGDCLMVLESVQCEVDPALFELHQDSDRKEEPISLLTSSDDDDVIIQEPRIDVVEVSDETDEDDRPLRNIIGSRKARKKKSGRKRGKSKVIVDEESVEYLPLSDLTPYHFSSAECRGERRPARPAPTVLRLCGRCGHAAASDAQLHRHRRTHCTHPRTHPRTHRTDRTHRRTHRARPRLSLRVPPPPSPPRVTPPSSPTPTKLPPPPSPLKVSPPPSPPKVSPPPSPLKMSPPPSPLKVSPPPSPPRVPPPQAPTPDTPAAGNCQLSPSQSSRSWWRSPSEPSLVPGGEEVVRTG